MITVFTTNYIMQVIYKFDTFKAPLTPAVSTS